MESLTSLRRPHRRRGGEGGFTLIELLVVCVIIGILAGVALPKYFHGICQGKEGAAISQVASLATAVVMYFADHDELPEGACVPFEETEAGRGRYMAEVPLTPWDGKYYYKKYGSNFLVIAAAEDGLGCDGYKSGDDGYIVYTSENFRVVKTDDDHGCRPR